MFKDISINHRLTTILWIFMVELRKCLFRRKNPTVVSMSAVLRHVYQKYRTTYRHVERFQNNQQIEHSGFTTS